LAKKSPARCSLRPHHGHLKDRRLQLPCCYCETCFAYEWLNCGVEACRELIQSAR
jgi:hypothetical protein